jgi:ubiquinone/menaquinone biosynthesis C-methylase UbiE
LTDHLLDQWETNAVAFADLINNQGTPHHRFILNPCIERMLGPVDGKRLLDAGCGEGYLCRYYFQKGARVVGVDFSSKMISIAKKKSKDFDIEYHVADICNLALFKENTFDFILCNLVLLNVECYEKALEEFFRVLESEGILVFSLVHPAFDVFGPGRWKLGEKSKDTGRREGQYFIMDRYFEKKEYLYKWTTRQGTKFPREFSFFHRPISAYISQLIACKFEILALEEPRPPPQNPFFERENRIPFFLCIKAKKL